jgi:hypothetical protein
MPTQTGESTIYAKIFEWQENSFLRNSTFLIDVSHVDICYGAVALKKEIVDNES